MLKPTGTPHTQSRRHTTDLSQTQERPLEAAERIRELAGIAEQKHRYHEALTLYQAKLNIGKDIDSSHVTIEALLCQGRLLCKTKQFKKAIKTLQDALLESSKDTHILADRAAEIRYTACNLIGTALWRDRQLSAAVIAVTKTIELARDRFGVGSPELFESLFARALLALEMGDKQLTIMEHIKNCIKEYQQIRGVVFERSKIATGTPEKDSTQKIETLLATKALELGTALYHHCLWDAASYVLDWSARIADCPSQRTEALLTLAHIASYKSDMRAVQILVDEAEHLWIDVTPHHIKRHIASLRAMAAVSTRDDETYRREIALAQEQGKEEDLSVEEQIQLLFTRAQASRYDGLEGKAQSEIEAAHMLVQQAVVSPLIRFNTYLQQGFCAHIDSCYDDSNEFIDQAIAIVSSELHGNKLLEARALWLRAQNNYGIYSCSNSDSSCARDLLVQSKRDGDAALHALTAEGLDPYCQIVILALLERVADDLNLPNERDEYELHRVIVEAEHLPRHT